ncbi:hypothetical protein NADFUDRAFT_63377 [Nadsonia fulvescens var. elongata DSM 6958]|uniref:Ras-GAP domain-containing protein n=1 Tax=Nadsonia fulvescens var. elongata DSM 6958 TaxID=857566 RepID=A0A1E3PR02_9ASCO|nr:hypothetical protein NADFUDRAFT_63377 [Nadsonia fulvescens var. elongata DSM 6958]
MPPPESDLKNYSTPNLLPHKFYPVGTHKTALKPFFAKAFPKLLPTVTGLSLSETESDEVFKLNKTAVLKLSKIGFLPDILESNFELMKNILDNDVSTTPQERSDLTLSSLALILRLCADLVDVYWKSLNSSKPNHLNKERDASNHPNPSNAHLTPETSCVDHLFFDDSIYESEALSSTDQILYLDSYVYYHLNTYVYSSTPELIDTKLVEKFLELLFRIRSESRITDMIHAVKTSSLRNNKVPPGIPLSSRMILIYEVDSCCSFIMRFLSASNYDAVNCVVKNELDLLSAQSPKLVSPVFPVTSASSISLMSPRNSNTATRYSLSDKMKLESSPNSSVPSFFKDNLVIPLILPPSSLSTENLDVALSRIDLFSSLFFSCDTLHLLFRDVGEAYSNISNVLHRNLLLKFFRHSLMYHVFSVPKDVIFIVDKRPLVVGAASDLFDCIESLNDSNCPDASVSLFLSTLLLFIPGIFDEYVKRDPKNNNIAVVQKNLKQKFKFLDLVLASLDKEDDSFHYVALACLNEISIGAAFVVQLNPFSTLVEFVNSLYSRMLQIILVDPKDGLMDKIPYIQAHFSGCWSILSRELVMKDIVPFLYDEKTPVGKLNSIIRGFSLLRGVDPSEPLKSEFLLDCFIPIRDFVISRVPRVVQMEKNGETNSQEFNLLVMSLIHAINIFRDNFTLYHHNKNFVLDYTGSVLLIAPIISGMMVQCSDLAKTCAAFATRCLALDTLHLYDSVEIVFGKYHPITDTYSHIGPIIKAISQKLLVFDTTDSRIPFLLPLLKNFMKTRCYIANTYKFFKITDGDITKVQNPSIRYEFSKACEVAILVLLCLPNMDICITSLGCLKLLVKEAILTENFDKTSTHSLTIMDNFHTYEELSSDSFIVTGPVAFHKRYLKYLKHMQVPSEPVTKAWEEIYIRWLNLTIRIETSFNNGSLCNDFFSEWRNYAGAISSLSGCFLRYGHYGNLVTINNYEPNLQSIRVKIENFIHKMVTLMFYRSPIIRQIAKDVLSRDTSNLAYHLIFKELERVVKNNRKMPSSANKKNSSLPGSDDEVLLLVAEQVTSFTKSVIGSSENSELYVNIDIGALVLQIAEFLDALPNNSKIIHLKIKMCLLAETLGKKHDNLKIRHDMKVRNKLTRIIVKWFEDASSNIVAIRNTATNNLASPTSASLSDRQSRSYGRTDYYDLAASSVNALASTLNGLVIDTPDAVHDIDSVSSKAGIFGSYFTMLLKVLESLKQQEDINKAQSGSHPDSQGSNSNWTPECSALEQEKLCTIRDGIIMALSHLLDSNADVGLKLALPLGLHHDLNIRLAFLEVFKNILNKGTQFSAESNKNQKYENLLNFLLENIDITVGICDNCPASQVDDLSYCLLSLFELKGKSLALIKEVVTKEVSMAESPSEILRRNCVATRMLSVYAKSVAGGYLRETLEPVLKDYTRFVDHHIFEINPETEKVNKEYYIEEMMKFQHTLDDLIFAFRDSVNLAPKSFKILCHIIKEAVEKKYSEATESAVGAFVFLRFFCPAIVSPEIEGIVRVPLTRELRRSLLFLAKTVQYLANGATGWAKLQTYTRMTDYMISRQKIIMTFLSDITVVDDYDNSVIKDTSAINDTTMPGIMGGAIGDQITDIETASVISSVDAKFLDNGELASLHHFLYENWEDINSKLKMENRKKKLFVPCSRIHSHTQRCYIRGGVIANPDDHEADNIEKDLEVKTKKLTSLIASLGKIASNANFQIPKNLEGTTKSADQLYEFMNKNASRDMSSLMESQIVHDGITQDGLPLIIVSIRNFDSSKIDHELSIYRYFQVASRLWHNKFGILYDCSGYSEGCAMSSNILSQAQYLVPDEMIQNCVCAYYYNVGTHFLPRLKMWIRYYGSMSFLNPHRVPYYFINSYSIKDLLNINGLGLDKRSEKLVTDLNMCYSDVQRYDRKYKDTFRSCVNIGNEYIQFQSLEPLYYVPNRPLYTNDSYHISKVLSVYSSNISGLSNEFTIEICGERLASNFQITLISSKASEIMRSIEAGKSRLSTGEENEIETVLRPEDVIATLFNIGLRSLCSSYLELRLSSYNLLASMQTRFGLDFGRDLRVAKGLAVPRHSLTLAISFSESLSLSHPQLTKDFITDFFDTYNEVPADKKQKVLLYVVPWIRNIYQYVYLANDEGGPENTRRIIRRFLNISHLNFNDYSSLLLNVWSALCVEEGLTHVLVEEIVSGALYWETEGHDIEKIISLLVVCPSMGICGRVLSRIRELMDVKEEDKNGGQVLVSKSNWKELVILIRVALYTVFETPLIVEQYLPDIFHIVGILVGVGRLEFRNIIYKLLMNAAHSFSVSDKLTSEKKDKLEGLLLEMAEPRIKLIFGLTSDAERVIVGESSNPIISKTHLENASSLMLEIIEVVGTVEEANIWRSRWTHFVVQVAFNNNSILQGRAMVLLGCLAKTEVDNEIIMNIITIICDVFSMSTVDEVSREDLLVCCLSCVTKLVDGIAVQSRYALSLFWLAVSSIQLVVTNSLYISSAYFLESVLRSLDSSGLFSQGDMVECLIDGLSDVKSEWGLISGLTNVSFTKETFDLAISAALLRGLGTAATRAATLKTFEAFLEIRAKNYIKTLDRIEELETNHPSYLVYFLFLFICSRSRDDIKDFFWLVGLTNDDEAIIGDSSDSVMDSNNDTTNDSIPGILVDYISSSDPMVVIAAVECGQLFQLINDDDLIELRLMKVLKHVAMNDPVAQFMIYTLGQSKICDLSTAHPNPKLMGEALDITIKVLSEGMDLNKPEYYENKLVKLLEDNGLTGITECGSKKNPSTMAKVAGMNALSPLLTKMSAI